MNFKNCTFLNITTKVTADKIYISVHGFKVYSPDDLRKIKK